MLFRLDSNAEGDWPFELAKFCGCSSDVAAGGLFMIKRSAMRNTKSLSFTFALSCLSFDDE